MTVQIPTSSTYIDPLDRDRTGTAVLAVGVPPAARDGIEAALADHGRAAGVVSATPATVAEHLESDPPDCVLAGDAADGRDALDVVESLPDDAPPAVLYVTAPRDGLAAEAINAGADGYFEHADSRERYRAVAERVATVAAEHSTVSELAETCRLLMRLTEYTNDALWMFSGDWSETAIINDAYESVWDRSIDDLIDDSADFLRAVHPDDVGAVEAGMARLSGGEAAELEYRIEYDNAYHWLSVHAEPVFDETGDVEYVAGFTRDVTDLKRREQSMRQLNERSTRLLAAREKSAVAQTVLDIVEDVVDCSLGVVREHDPDTGTLRPLAATDSALDLVDAGSVSGLRTVGAEDPMYDVFREGTPRLVEGAALESIVGPDAGIGSLLVLPLGDHGVLGVGTTQADPFDGFDRDLVELLARTATAALDRVERDEQLEAYREELEQSNENLQQFAYIASHDLQEPLRMVSSYVDLLDSEYGDELDEEAREYMDFAVDGAARMKEMIDGLLAYSRVQTQGSTFEPVDATEVLEQTLRELSLFLEETDLTVEYDDLPTVRADPTQLGQVFQNLVKNAADHGAATTVEVTATEDEGTVEFVIADDGVGIPDDQRETIFDIFEQGHDATGGSGIGLAVCDRIVSRHGGDIWVRPGPEGGGAAFSVQLPKATDGGRSE